MTLKEKAEGADFTMEVHLAALYAKRKELGRNLLTPEEREAVIADTEARIEAGKHPSAILAGYSK